MTNSATDTTVDPRVLRMLPLVPPSATSLMRFASRPGHLSALVLGGFFLVPASARASGFDTALFGNDDGHPAIGNAYAVYYNPAAMVEVRGTEMIGAATV